MPKGRGTLAIQCVFAALVVATFAAFFVTTRLKRSPPVVEQLEFRRHFSPNDDGRLDREPIAFRLRRADDVTVSIVSEDGDQVATIADDVPLAKGAHRFRWDGRGDDGEIVADGEYRVRVRLRHQGRAVNSPRKLFVDTTPPESVVRFVSPDAITPGSRDAGSARVRFVGPTRRPPTLLVYRTDSSPPQLVARRSGRKDSSELHWNGRVGLAGPTTPAPAGNYMMVVRTRDAAGNDGPASLPPPRSSVRGNPGLIVRYLAGVAPNGATAGDVADFDVLAAGARYRWQLQRLGSQRSLKRGSSREQKLRVGIPGRGRSGVYLLQLRSGPHRYTTPFAVRGRRAGKALVVLPQTTWIARDPLDSNADGYPDTLPTDPSVPLRRPISGNGLPAGFSANVEPVLRFLDGNGFDYDVISDGDPQLARRLAEHDGVLFPAAPVVALASVTELLRKHVAAGKTLAWIGAGGFTLAARSDKGSLLRVPARAGENAFGERLRADPVGGLLTVQSERGGLFEQVASPFGPLAGLETGLAPPDRMTRASAAGIDADPPAIVVYRDGEGMIVRVGVAAFGRSLVPEVGLVSSNQIMRNLWNLLR